jgi:hypothetical protein
MPRGYKDTNVLEFRHLDGNQQACLEPQSHEALKNFQQEGQWIECSNLTLFQAIQLAVCHPVYASGLRIYYYLGLARDKTDKAYLAFISEQTSGGKGPSSCGRCWARKSLAVYMDPKDATRFVNPAEIILVKGRDGHIFGRKYASWERKLLENARRDLVDRLRHLSTGHLMLYDNLCRHFLAFNQKWWIPLRNTAAKMLQSDSAQECVRTCQDKSCPLIRRLREAMEEQVLAGANLQSQGTTGDGGRGLKARDNGKVQPTNRLCHFTTGEEVRTFLPSEHRLEQFTSLDFWKAWVEFWEEQQGGVGA